MKRIIFISALTLAIFAVITFATAKIERPIDGNDTYGFPLTFYIKFSGMCDDCDPNANEIKFLNLLADVLLTAIISIGLTKFILFFIKQAKDKT